MTDSDHERLIQRILILQGYIVLSAYGHDMYDDMLLGWKKVQTKALADGGRPRTEILWISPNIVSAPTLFHSQTPNYTNG